MFFFILNTFLVFELNEKFNFTYEHTCRIASIVHALFCVVGSTLYLTERVTLEHVVPIIDYNAIYILTDLILYLTNSIKDKHKNVMIFHHVLFITAICLAKNAIYISETSVKFYFTALLSETSNIFLNTRWFAINTDILNNVYAHTFMLWLTFLIFRVINLSYLVVKMYQSEYYFYSFILAPFILLNYIWFGILTKILFVKKIKDNNNKNE